MARKATSSPAQGELRLLDAPAPPEQMRLVEERAAELAGLIGSLPLDQQVAALNHARTVLHGVSPFQEEPVDLVLWIRADRVVGYDEYKNPNSVAPPEMEGLAHSMTKNGVALALVTHETDDADVVVDGMHRRSVGSTNPVLRARLHGYLPVSRIRADRSDVGSRIAATVEFNRFRGEHSADAMSALVRLLYELGWTDDRIQKELGMELDEVVRLKQITGIAALFADRDYSPAWEPL